MCSASGGDFFRIDALTPREDEVLTRIGEGLTGRQIAGQLGITAKTVEHYRESIKAKLQIRRTAGLIRYALRGKS